jgi:glycerol-3-phosphate acyltransferase PlsX
MGVIRLAIDAMGGDYAPAEIVAGAVAGARDFGLNLILVGDPDTIQRELARQATDGLPVEVVPSSGAVRMDEDPVQAVRTRPEVSINVACSLVLQGRADGVLSMGHSGASVVAGLFHFGPVAGVDRPAIVAPLLGLRENMYLVDAGANTEVRPQHLVQFALMGAAYVECATGVARPRVALLSNGSEMNKGNKVSKGAFPLLAAEPKLNFAGNVEGSTLLTSDINVVVCDGFVGNIFFKSTEGVIEALLTQVEAMLSSLPPEMMTPLQPRWEALKERSDYATYGAAALVGLKHPLFIGHGHSRAKAVRNSIATAKKMIEQDVLGRISHVLKDAQTTAVS